MQTKFKRHQEVKLLREPNYEYVEYHLEDSEQGTPIKKGMAGKINLILPNGQYHVEVFDENGKLIAYAPFNEEDLEAVD